MAAFLYLGTAPVADAAAPRDPVQELVDLVNRSSDDESEKDLVALQRAAVEAGPAAVRVLGQLLASESPSRRSRVAYALAFTAQPEGSDLLLREFTRSKDQGIKGLTCFALARRGTAADIQFLVGALKGEHYGDQWYPIQVAALSLGVLRATSALGPLQATAKKEPSSIASGAAEDAIAWIKGQPFDVQSRINSPGLSPLMAVVSHGIPRIDESAVFYETQAGRMWTREGRIWTVQALPDRKVDGPTISFEPYVSSDNRRAVVAVGLVFGPLNGVGYDYLLALENKEWKVIGVLPTWIS